jgi:hypothetical protein
MEDFEALARAGRSREVRLDLRLIADEDDVHFGVFRHRLDRSLHDRAGRVVAAHRIECDTHRLTLLGFFNNDGFAGLRAVPAAMPADDVRANRFAAASAVDVLLAFQVQVAATFALARLGGAPFRYGHDWDSLLENSCSVTSLI